MRSRRSLSSPRRTSALAHAPTALLGAVLTTALLGCGGERIVEPEPGPRQGPDHVELGYDRPTTEGAVALANLETSIDSLAMAYDGFRDPSLMAQRVDTHLTRAAFAGHYDDFDAASALRDEALATHADAAEAHAIDATVRAAVHDFVGAREALDRADALGYSPRASQRARLSIAVALGEVDDAVVQRARDFAEGSPGFATLNTLATVLAANGEFDEADATYRAALQTYRDVSPFPVAWSFFVRGVMWAEMADRPDLGRPLYEAAVARLPGYVVANVHLAELESSAGETERAARRYESVLDSSRDPEPAGRLAQLLDDSDPARAQALRADAAARYDLLLERHRAAFLDHAAEFFAGAGQAERSLELALENLELRNTARARKVAIESALAAGDEALACEIADAEQARSVHPVLDALAAELSCAQDG